jgi:exodeoxyribonuclease VIII
MHFFKGVNVMIDLETYDTTPTAAVRSIGAVKFDCGGILDKFYVNVDLQSCVDLGLTVSEDTVQWWEKQGEGAKRVLDVDPIDIRDAMQGFREWYGSRGLPTWGNGSNFDNPILEHVFRRLGMKCPWEYWQDRCFRTIASMFKYKPEFKGVKHYALDDAIHQANILIDIQKCFSKGSE